MLRTKFEHSVRVPRLYKLASTVAKNVIEGKGSLKHLVFQQKHPNIKAIQSLVSTLVQKNNEIDRILKKSQFLTKEPRCDIWLAKILLVELLWGKGCLKGQSKPECTVRAYEQIFKAHLSDEKQDWDDNTKNKALLKPRYVRVNTLQITLEEVIEGFQNEGWELLEVEDKSDYAGFLEKVKSLTEGTFLIDIHIPNVLVFPPKTEFFKHPAYKKGYLILQDKASCLPVHILNPPPGSIVLDMCAAPGMKTTHLAANLENKGTVYAVERDPRRFEVLNNIITSSGATCIKTFNKDVLTCYKTDFPDVEYILVDPSCSGSGMTDRQDFQEKLDIHRLEKLAGFQIKILRSALTRYPNAKRVVYSTCSVYTEENEDVVRQVLETNYNFKLVPGKRFLNDAWANVGSADFGEIGEYCLYAQPKDDYTNGFFVAVFERLKEGEQNYLFNDKIFSFKRDTEIQQRRQQKYIKKKLQREQRNLESQAVSETPQQDENFNQTVDDNVNTENTNEKKKKKKKKNKNNDTEEIINLVEDQNAVISEEYVKESSKLKKKKNKIYTDELDHISNDAIDSEIIEILDEPHIKKKKKHKKQDKSIENNDNQYDVSCAEQIVNVEEINHSKKKNKKIKVDIEEVQHKTKKNKEIVDNSEIDTETENAINRKRKKEEEFLGVDSHHDIDVKSKQKKKKTVEIVEIIDDIHQEPEKKMKHKKKNTFEPVEIIDDIHQEPEIKFKHKKKEIVETVEIIDDIHEPEIKIKHKKKKHRTPEND